MQAFAGLAAGIAIMLALAGWRLSTGPVSLAFLTPYIEDTFSQDENWHLDIEDTVLAWAGWERTLDIRILKARVLDRQDQVIAAVPELSISLSAQALSKGLIAPKSIDLFRPGLKLDISEDGKIEFAFSNPDQTSEENWFQSELLPALLEKPSEDKAQGYLTRISIFDGDLLITNQASTKEWHAPVRQLTLNRSEDGIEGHMVMDLTVQNQTANLSFEGFYVQQSGRVDVGISFQNLNPALFSEITPEAQLLSAIDLSVGGTATLSLLESGYLESIGFDLGGDKGTLHLPDPLKQDLDVLSLKLRGYYAGINDRLEIEEFLLFLGENGKLHLPEPTNHDWPLRSVKIAGAWMPEDAQFDLKFLKADMRGPTAELSAMISGIGSSLKLSAEGKLRHVPGNDVAVFWPKAWGTDAWIWSTGRLSNGEVIEARASVELSQGEEGDIKVDHLKGDMLMNGVTVDYLPPMPKAHKVNGTAKFDQKRFIIYASSGEIGNLKLSKGAIFLTGLDEYDQYADIALQIDGPLKEAMQLADHKPLEYVRALGFNPEKADGHASTDLKLHLILEKDLDLEDVDVSAKATLTGISLEDVVLTHDLTEGNLDLYVDKVGMDVSGEAKLSKIPTKLAWRQNFTDNAGFISRYDVEATLNGIDSIEDLGFDIGPFDSNVIAGDVDTKIRYTILDKKRSTVDAEADLTKVALGFPQLNWSKESDIPGKADVRVLLENNLITGIPRFSVVAADLEVKGAVQYSPSGIGLDRIEFDKVVYGKTNMAGSISARADGGWHVDVKGASFDLEPLWADLTGNLDEAENNQSDLMIDLLVQVDKVWLGDDQLLKQVFAHFHKDEEMWREVAIRALVGDNKPLTLSIAPGENGNRQLAVNSEDAGETLKVLGLYDDMLGGQLTIAGEYDDTVDEALLAGEAQVQDFRVVDAPVLAHVVSVVGITGILDALQGDGLGFVSLTIPYDYHNSIITLKDVRATGLSLGVTASGTVNTKTEEMDLTGTVIPAYYINSALGRIPLLGKLFSGGEKGGGVFAAKYAVKGVGDDVDVKVSSLTALAPGIFRNLFGAPEIEAKDEDEDEVTEDQAPAAEAEDASPVKPWSYNPEGELAPAPDPWEKPITLEPDQKTNIKPGGGRLNIKVPDPVDLTGPSHRNEDTEKPLKKGSL